MKPLHCLPLVITFLAWTTAAHAQGANAPLQFLKGDDGVALEASDQSEPSVAAGAGIVLATWTDHRAYPSVVSSRFSEYETASDVYGLRLDPTGTRLDSVPFPIARGRGGQEAPQVAWNGTHWLVAFESTDVAGTGFYYQSSLEAVRVSPTGQVLDDPPIKVRNVEPTGSSSWALASDGQDWAIGFQSSDSNSSLHGLKVTSDGTVLMPPQTLVPSTYFLRNDLRLAWAGGVYLFAWHEFSDVKALRLDASLQPLDPAPVTLLANSVLADLASDGFLFYAVWHRQDVPLSTVELFGSRVDPAGTLLDGTGVNLSNGNSPLASADSQVVHDGTSFRVTWNTTGGLRIARIKSNGEALPPGGVSVAGPQAGPTAALPAGGVLVSWDAVAGNESDVFGATIDSASVAGPNTNLSLGAPMQFRPDAAMGGTGSMIVFRSDLAGTNRVLAQPLALDGTPLTTDPVVLDSGPRAAGPGTPAVAWNGATYLATWSNPSGIVAVRIAQDGSLLDPAPFSVTTGFGPMDVAAVGDTFLVVGRNYGFTTQIINTVAVRVRGTDGMVLDPSGLVIGANHVRAIAVTTFGSRWFAAWRANFTHDDPLGATYGTFVQSNGTFGPQFRVSDYSSTNGGNGIFEVAVASDGVQALVLQSAELSSGVETDLAGVLVSGAGVPGAQFNLTPWQGNQYAPRVAFEGTEFVVVYNEQRNRFAAQTLDQLDARGDLFGMRVATDGTKLDPLGFAFSISQAAETHPNVTAAAGVSLIVGAVLCDAPYESYRIGHKLFGEGGDRWPVAVATSSTALGDVPLSVDFDGTESFDPEGIALGYAWDFGDGSGSTLAAPVHTYTVPGEYVVTLTVTDAAGISTTNTVPVLATAPNILPVAVATATPRHGTSPLPVTLFAESSYDPDGAIGNAKWTFSDGGTYFGSTAFHTFDSVGRHTATLEVFDSRFGVGKTEIAFHVYERKLGYGNRLP